MSTIYDTLRQHIATKKPIEYKRGEIIYHEGEVPKHVWLLEEGLVGLFHITSSGRETFLRVFGERYILGHRSTIAGEPFHANAVALTTSKLYKISTEDFITTACKEGELLFKISKVLARDLRQAEERLAGITDKTAPQRIVEALLYLRFRHPDQAWTRKEIAEFSSSTMETVTRVMAQLESEGLLIKDKRRFDIPNPQRVVDWAHAIK